jgi:hypothetical protein
MADDNFEVAGPFTGDAGGGGFLGKIKDLFKNKQFIQMLGANGADLLGNTPGKNSYAALSQNISSQGYSKLLENILGGKHPGVDAKLSDKGLALNILRETPVDQSGPNPGQTGIPQMQTGGGTTNGGGTTGIPANAGAISAAPGTTPSTSVTPAPGTTPTSSNSMQDLIKQLSGQGPFAPGQLDFSGVDLAGVSPELITQALQLKLQGEQVGNQRMQDIANALYQQGQLEHGKVEEGLTQQLRKSEQQNADTNTAKLTQDKKPDMQKQFEFAQTKEGGEFKGSFSDFKDSTDTGDWKNYQHYVDEEKSAGNKPEGFNSWLLKHEKTRSGMTLGQKLEEVAAKSSLQGPGYFDNPDWTKDIDKSLNSEVVQSEIYNTYQGMLKANKGMSVNEARQIATRDTKIKLIENQIAASTGKISGIKLAPDGKTVIWTVQWPDTKDENGKLIRKGKVGTISNAVQ